MLGWACLGAATAAAAESQSYVADRISVVAGAGTCSSFTFDHSMVVSPVAPAGHSAACGASSVAHFGFWSVLGTPDMPTSLALERGALDRAAVDLSWTGSATAYQVYRSDLPAAVLDPANLLAETSSCTESDPAPPPAGVLYYRVVPQP